jgi:predicted acetyltransferase
LNIYRDGVELLAGTAAHARAVMQLRDDVGREGRWIGTEGGGDIDLMAQRYLEQLQDESRRWFVVVDGDDVIGAIYIQDEHGIAELMMMIASGFRGRGLGRQMLDAAVEWAEQRGCRKISLEVWPHNEPARRLYLAAGFQDEGRLRRQWPRRNGEVWDSILMVKVLDTTSPGSPWPDARVPSLRLRLPRLDDEDAVRAAQSALRADDFLFALWLDEAPSWTAYLDELDRRREDRTISEDQVPSVFLLADVGGELVGRSSIRFALNDFLLREGGHIGYGVLPAHRRRGYATEILRQSLAIVRAQGVDRVLVTCDVDNAASATVIERCGGVLEDIHEESRDGIPKRRYWID